MAKLMTYSQAISRFANLATTGIGIEEAIQEAVDRIYEMGRWPGTTVEIELAEADFIAGDNDHEWFVYFNEETYDGTIGFRNLHRGWSIVDHSSLYRDGINAGDREFLDMGTISSGSGISFASLQVNPSGDDNTLNFTSAVAGTAGALTSITIASSVASSKTAVLVAGTAITITPGTKARMIISGTLTPDASITVYSVQRPPAQFQSTNFYYDSGSSYPRVTIYQDFLSPWTIRYYPNLASYPSSPSASWQAFAGSFTYPSDASGWNAQSGATGTPTVTAGASIAAQVIEAIEASAEALGLVLVEAEGASTGVMASVSETFLVLPNTFSSYRKYRAPLGFVPSDGPYYALMKLEAPVLEDDTVIPIHSAGALKCAILAVCQEYVNDDDRAMLNWQKFDSFIVKAAKQVDGPKRWSIGMDSSLRRKPTQFL